MTELPSDCFRLPEPDGDGVISTCVPFTVDIASLEVGDELTITMKFKGTGKSENRLVEKHLNDDSRVQILIPANDPLLEENGPPEWLSLYHKPGVSIQRKTWSEGKKAVVVLRRDTEEVNDLKLHILIVLNNLKLRFDEYCLAIVAERKSPNGGSNNIANQYVSFTEDLTDILFGGTDDDLMTRVFAPNGAYDVSKPGSVFHPKQIHSYNSVIRALEEKIEEDNRINITYVGPDTCENLHSTIRAIRSLVNKGLVVGTFYILHTRWDERSMDNLRILNKGYFEDNGCNFNVEFVSVESSTEIESDLIITTYVTNWAFNSGKRGTAAEQYLSNILKQIRNRDSMIISVDPFDVNKVTRSFYQLGHQGRPTIVYQSAGLELQSSAPGGYGDIIKEQEREVCWVTCYKEKTLSNADIKEVVPMPNDIAQILGVVNPAGREAYLERLATPMLEKYDNWKDVLSYDNFEEEEEEEAFAKCTVVNAESLIQSNERFRIVIGGPGDGKTVLLQQIGWAKNTLEDEVTIFLSARRLTTKEHFYKLNMHEGEQKLSAFFDIIENECLAKYNSLNWNGDLAEWIAKKYKLNLCVDALDEVRDVNFRTQLFALLLDCCESNPNFRVTLSMRENILAKSFDDLEDLKIKSLEEKNYNSLDHEVLEFQEVTTQVGTNPAEIPIYKLFWDEDEIVNNFIPSLLHGWNMKIDSQSQRELERFIKKSTHSLNRTSRGDRTFLKNPLRAVWLVKFVYDQSVDLQEMDLSEFENQILKLSVKNRFENRRLKNQVSDLILEELLDFVATISVLDYDWGGQTNNFGEENRRKFVNHISSSMRVNGFFKDVEKKELQLFLFEDMSLLYIAEDDNLAWIHENLREHAIARGVMKYNNEDSIPHSLLSQWGFTPPSLQDIFCNPRNTCSIELSEAIRRIIPNEVLLEITRDWFESWMDKDSYVDNIISLPDRGADGLIKFTGFLQSARELAKYFRDKRNERNSQYKDALSERNRFNSLVKSHNNEVRKLREERNRWNELVKQNKSLRNEANKMMKTAQVSYTKSSDDPEERKLLKTKFEHAKGEQKKTHKEVVEAVKLAQNAHEKILEIGRETKRIRELSNISHKLMVELKKEGDHYHGDYIFLIKRLERELKKRRSSLFFDFKSDVNKEWFDEIKKSIIEFYDIEFEGDYPSFDEIQDSIQQVVAGGSDYISEISIRPNKRSCTIDIVTVVANMLVGVNRRHLMKLNEHLEEKFLMKFEINIMGEKINGSDLEEFFKNNLDVLIRERLGDYEIDVTEIEFKPYTVKATGQVLGNRKILIRTRDPALLRSSSFTTILENELKTNFGSPVWVAPMGIDIQTERIYKKLVEIFDKENLSEFVDNITIDNLNDVEGRSILIETTNPSEIRDKINNIIPPLEAAFGKPFQLRYSTDWDPIPLSELKDELTPIIENLTEDREDFQLIDITSSPFDGSEGRNIVVTCFPEAALIGNDGSIAKKIRQELENKFGTIRFSVTSPDIEKNDVRKYVEYLIHNEVGDLPTDFKIHSIVVGPLTKKGKKLQNRLIKLNASHSNWLAGSGGWRARKLEKYLVIKFGGVVSVLVQRNHQFSNLKSEDVRGYLSKIIGERCEDWGIGTEFPLKNVGISAYNGATGRKIVLDWPMPSDIRNTSNQFLDEIKEYLIETFSGSFLVLLKILEFSEIEIKESVCNFLSDKIDVEHSNILLSPVHEHADMRFIKIYGPGLSNADLRELKEHLVYEYGKPFKVMLRKSE